MIILERHASLASFPPELVGQICTHLTQESLSHLSKTCKLFRASVQPILFSSIKHRPRLISFLRALVARPDLAKVVKTAVISEYDYGELSAVDQKLIEDCIIRLGAPALPSGWVTVDEEPHKMTVMELVIACTPNLEVLEICIDYDWYPDVLQHLTGTLSLLKLKTLTVYQNYISGDTWEVPMRCVQPLLEAAPNLTTFIIPTFNDTFDNDSYPVRNLRHLKFDEIYTGSSKTVVNMLASCPLLETFSMHWSEYDPGDFDAMDIWRALEQKKGSLRELFLTIQLPEQQIRNPVAARPRDLSSLQTFTKLEVVKIYEQALDLLFRTWASNNPHLSKYSFLLQLLPASIVEAEFMQPSTLFIPAMLELSRLRACPFPLMKRLSLAVSPEQRASANATFGSMFGNLAGHRNGPNVWHTVERELTEGFARQGVRFEVRDFQGWQMDEWSTDASLFLQTLLTRY